MKRSCVLIGTKIGLLTIVKKGNGKVVGKKNPKIRSTHICKCDCGKEIEILTSNLRRKNPNSTSCGCKFLESTKYNFKDLTGQIFGQLKVIKRLPEYTKTRGALWECECKCGDIVKLASNSLTSGNNTTCGNKSNHENTTLDNKNLRFGELPATHVSSIKQNAIKRNLPFEVTGDYLWELFLKQNRKCSVSNIDLVFTPHRNSHKFRYLTTASLDRIDSSKGYIVGNVRWVHKDINKMMSNYGDTKFIDYCTRCINTSYSKVNRPSWDEYFLMIAFTVSTRSEDPNIKHGAVLVNCQNQIIGTGYNSPIKGSINELIPMNIREEKRKWMIHAEENCILNATQNSSERGQDCKLYVTGLPCNNCLQRIINFGIKKIIIADRIGSITDNEESKNMRNNLISMSKIEIKTIDINNHWIKKYILNIES
jgi:dCMP deaminase